MSDANAPLEPDLTRFAAEVGALRPAALAHRDRILYLAGRASASPPPRSGSGRRFWPAAAMVCAALALGEGVLLAHRPVPTVVERIVVVHEPAVAPPAPFKRDLTEPVRLPQPAVVPPERGAIATPARWREQMARFDLDAYPPSPRASGLSPRLPALFGRDLFRQELRTALYLGDRS